MASNPNSPFTFDASGYLLTSATSGGGGASTPADFSVNAPAVPIGGMVLLATIPATANRTAVEVQNQSANTVQVVRDDGAATAGTISSVLLAGAGVGAQGGDWSSITFKGRVRVYGIAGAQIAVFQE